ncbi:hypothetical protein [Nocardia cerradoensis]|uniref:hypothetical protein n=1 Tax=Nocardia cerradoensis TaxID=85688 RepID=UPI0005854C08|nr:hypothetical protein [Nocardia cerradoensis]NKY42118.1 hypothetical protein [Nocardia cerradoensis]
MAADFAHRVKLNVDLFFRYLRTGIEPGEDDTADMVRLAVERVPDGAAVTDVLDAPFMLNLFGKPVGQ